MELTLEQLKLIADKIKFQYHHNVGEPKLREQLIKHCIDIGTTLEEVVESMGFKVDNDKLEDGEKLDNENKLGDENKSPNKKEVSNKNLDIERLSNLTFAEVEIDSAKKDENNLLKDAMRLIRCSISCNNKNKISYQGEIFSVRNSKLPEIKKFIPFNTVTHIPLVMFNMIKEKDYQMFKKIKAPNGSIINKPFLVKEYSIQELPPITKEELEAIKQKQLAEGFDGV